jgi:hypothetical protein
MNTPTGTRRNMQVRNMKLYLYFISAHAIRSGTTTYDYRRFHLLLHFREDRNSVHKPVLFLVLNCCCRTKRSCFLLWGLRVRVREHRLSSPTSFCVFCAHSYAGIVISEGQTLRASADLAVCLSEICKSTLRRCDRFCDTFFSPNNFPSEFS